MRTLFFMFVCLASQIINSQTLKGTIVDLSANKPLAGANVYLLEINKNTFTNENGEYSFPNLGKGVYKLKISHLGFATKVETITIASKDENLVLDFGLESKTFQLDEVVISNAFFNKQNKNIHKIDVVKKSNLQRNGAVTIMDAIEKVPGVDAVTTGPMVSRPVIRGLSGNRVLTVVDGMRFETQQWDDEHGIGVNELGLDRIEIIKGPSSLLYGPEAMGGIVHMVKEQPAEVNTKKGYISSRLFSNNLGASTELNLQGAKEKFNWGVNALGRLLSDYFYNGYDFRVPNTRLLEYGGKAYVGKNGKWGSTTASYLFNKAYYGILDGKDIVKNADGQIVNIDSLEAEKFPLEIEAPFHTVTDNRLNSMSTFLLGKSKIESTFGYQNNHRTENEELKGVKKGYTYLDMRLQTVTYDVKWHLPNWYKFSTIIGTQGMYQNNKNLEDAATQLIPDATINDIGFLGLTKLDLEKLSLSFGARYDSRNLHSKPMNATNSTTKRFNNVSYSLAGSYLIGERLIARASFASGYRTPNLNELFSYGVKLENQRFEIGDQNLTKETNHEIDFNLLYTSKNISIEGSVYNNLISDYIYIAPTGNTVPSNIDPAEMSPEYKYHQSDARIYGGEAGIDIHPVAIKWSHFESKISTLTAKRRDNDSYLPTMPATKLFNTLYFNFDKIYSFKNAFVSVGTVTAFDQNKVANNEMKTPGYTLLNAALGATFRKLEFTLAANNILDTTYLDHMSRFRSYEIIEPGINIQFGVKIPLDLTK
jgi:iron complex outermembrane recepter protein